MKQITRKQADVRNRRRQGVAAAEFAVCLPLIVVLLLGTLEATSIIYLKQSLSIAAYEGARTAVGIGASDADVQEACRRFLTQRKVAGYSISVSPSPIAQQEQRSWITVSVTAPCAPNSAVRGLFSMMSVSSVTGQAGMMKEF